LSVPLSVSWDSTLGEEEERWSTIVRLLPLRRAAPGWRLAGVCCNGGWSWAI
jgi:hypothetical protein